MYIYEYSLTWGITSEMNSGHKKTQKFIEAFVLSDLISELQSFHVSLIFVTN